MNVKMSILILFGACVIGSTFVTATDDSLADNVVALTKLNGEAYYKERKKLLEKKLPVYVWDSTIKSSKNWMVKVIAQSILFEIKNSQAFSMLLNEQKTSGFGTVKQRPPRQLELLHSRHARAVILCFGANAFAVMAESILFGESHKKNDAMDVILEARNELIPEVLVSLSEDKTRPALVRANAVWRLEKCLQGLPIITLKKKDFENQLPIGIPLVPEKWMPLAKDRELPALELNQEKRNFVINALIGRLESDSDEQVRALSANEAQFWRGQKAIKSLSTALAKDISPWVRAWCAVSLTVIGDDEALQALESAKKTEKNDEVLLVLEGKAKPFAPWNGIPKNSILQKSNDTPSNAP